MSNDAAAVEAAARDYVEGWYTGDSARMDSSLHDDLAKRARSDDGESLRPVSKSRMVVLTAGGGGSETVDPEISIAIDDIDGDIASVRVVSPDFIDYLHLVKTPAGWKIANVLFRDR